MNAYSYRVIRKRVVWLMGQWVGVKMSVSLRPALYEAILSLLHKDEDLAVRLEAAHTLKTDILLQLFWRHITLIFQTLS